MDETGLAEAAARGNQEAFASLFLLTREFVYSVAYRVMLNEDDALDVTQCVYLKLASRIGDYSGRGSFRGWLATITTNEALSQLRKPHRRDVATSPDELPDRPTRSHTAVALAEHNEQRALVDAAMSGLTPQQRAILQLQCHEDIGPSEIAERLNVPASQVRVQLRKAILKLREMILTKPRPGGKHERAIR